MTIKSSGAEERLLLSHIMSVGGTVLTDELVDVVERLVGEVERFHELDDVEALVDVHFEHAVHCVA